MKCERCGKQITTNAKQKYDKDKEFKPFKVLCEDCRQKIYNEILKKLGKKEEARRRKIDAEMKKKGHRYKVDYWIHPVAGGDDKNRFVYFPDRPTRKDIQALLRESAVKNDYVILKL